MANYTIDIKRGKDSGTLTYSGGVSVSTTCWWDPKRKIPARTYTGCSATTMATKKNSLGKPREAIFFPDVPGYKGIFIHMGTNAAWSDGCIVIAEAEIKKIYNDILPKDGKNVTVTVSDE
ncbi:MAG: L,D-transpeptidase [Planctomycetes bacterium]|nr:L,D-transpeptidase [Planctomycetota bacterium]